MFTPYVGYTKEGQNIIVCPTFYVNIDALILTCLDICPGMVYCHCFCIHVHVLLLDWPECMRTCFSIGGMCDTLENSVFSGFSGAIGVFYRLGQYDLLYIL